MRCSRQLGPFVIAGASVLLGSCAPFQSSHLANTVEAPQLRGKARVGQFYFLPRARLTIEGKPEKVGGAYQVTVERVLEANPDHRFFLEYRPNVLFNDDIQALNVNELGLLTLVTLHTEDQTLQALDELTKAAINVYKVGSGLPESGALTSKVDPQPFRVTFDPLSFEETQSAIAIAARSHVRLLVSSPSSGSGATTRYLDSPKGIYYHPPTAVGVTLDFTATSVAEILRKTITIPDPSVIATYAFKRNAFVKREQSLTLEGGMPKEMTLSKPSQFMGVSSGISAITNTVKDALPDLINVKVEQTDREISRLNQINELEKAREALSQERAKRGPSQSAADHSSRASASSNTPTKL